MHIIDPWSARRTGNVMSWSNGRAGRFLGGGGVDVSFEFSPPTTIAVDATLWRSITRLEPLNPVNVSVTYGAHGATRERTHATVARILKETQLKVAAHLTCAGATRGEVNAIAETYWDMGVRHIVALRGDPPSGNRYVSHPGGYESSIDLIKGLKAIAPFEITVATYPEKHPASPSIEHDIDMLKAKIDAGATGAITQFFFDNDTFLRFRDRLDTEGITIPVIPGILPIYNLRQVERAAFRSRVRIPHWLAKRVDGLDDDRETRRVAAAALSAEQILDLVAQGVGRVHFFTLNRADVVFAICHMIGLRGTRPTA